ncbi:Glycoprotein-N-acetylgalactosamine 3-beta-galactosyltransferase 1 [Chionoecetes opilio]|uniref:Glycoprotein-N-acetylgalactosamine 3-beta-galactosyltransferase 1 n=1 Tax=Chionoecetes opilio TaxID=41210 RepID=A0A8J5CLP6_CHIOP|nr:Glycoprotein-N-acetylgalactosamine 3-beta-galactosyltransferase 1 [Chionoecetes opilio]
MRLQFPIRVAFAMTINKCQGQTKSYGGVSLPTPVFTHDQLYVSLSRVDCADAVEVSAPRGITRNVVYPRHFDQYVVMENMRYMLNSYDPHYPIYFGSRFKKFTKQGYMSGGK